MALTQRASRFLQHQQWRADAVHDPAVIEQAFRRAGRTLTPALQDFQTRYGGLMVYAGLEPICFGILHGELTRGDFQREYHKLLPWPPDEDCPHWHYTCADTLYQENFTLDEEGGYYEGYQLHASSFDGVIENLAVFADLRRQGYQQVYECYGENLQLPDEVLCRQLHLHPYPDYPADVIFWGKNDQLVVQRGVEEIRVFAMGALLPEMQATLDELMQTYSASDIAARKARAAVAEQLQRNLSAKSSWLKRLLHWLKA